MSNADVELLYGVSGGGNLNQGSGREIAKTLKQIVRALDKAKVPTIKIFFDEKDLKTKINSIKERLSKELKDAGKISVNTGTRTSSNSTQSKTQVQETRRYLQLKQQIDAAYKAQADFAKNNIGSNQEIEASIDKVLDKINTWKSLNDTQRKSLKEYATMLSSQNEADLIKQQQIEYGNLQRAIKEVGNEQREFYRTKYNESERYNQLSQAEATGIQDLKTRIKEANISEQQRSQLNNQVTQTEIRNQSALENARRTQLNSYDKFVLKSNQYISQMNKEGLSTKEAKAQLEELQRVARKPLKLTGDAEQDIITIKKELQELQDTYFRVSSNIAKSGASDPTTMGNFIKALGNKFQSMVSGALIATAGRALMQIYSNVLKLDSAITNLQIATGGTRESVKGLMDDYAQLAQQLGVTTIEVAEAADTWLRQGYSVAQTNELIANTMMLAKLGQLESAEAAKALTSAIKGYKLEVEDAMSVVDKFTAVDMEAAIGAGDIATAMAETAASAEVAGIELDTLIGYIATVGEVTQDGAESVGTFFKTLFARMGSVAAGSFVDESTGESLNDVEKVLNNVGISLRDNSGEFREFGYVLDEVGEQWETYNNIQKHAIATAFAGTRQQEKFIVLMENYGQALEYANVAAESAGTAQDKYQTAYLDSVEAKLNKLASAWSQFGKNVLDSELVKLVVDVVKVIANTLNAVLELGDGFVVKFALIGATVALTVATMNNAFGNAGQGFTKFITLASGGLKKLGTSLLSLAKNPTMVVVIALTTLITLMQSASSKTAKWSTVIIAAIMAIGSVVVLVLKQIKHATEGFLATNVFGWILLAITAVVVAVKSLIDLFKKPSYADLKEAAENAIDEWKEVEEELATIKEELDTISEQIDAINSKPSLSLVDKEELAYLKQQQAILEQEANLKEEEARQAEKNAAESAMKAMDKYANASTYKKPSTGKRILMDWLTAGVSEIVYEVKQETADSRNEKFDKILANWNNASQSDKDYVTNYLGEMRDYFSKLNYQTGDNLEGWQTDINRYFDEYYYQLDQYNIKIGEIQSTWDSVFSRVKYTEATDALTELADNWRVSSASLQELYNTDGNVKNFLNYLQQLGLFAWNDAESVDALVEQIRQLANINSVAEEDSLSILDSIADKYDKIHDAMSDINELGILSADTFKELMEIFPEWGSGIEELEDEIARIKEEMAEATSNGDNVLLSNLEKQLKSSEEELVKLQEFIDMVGFEKTEYGYKLSEDADSKYLEYIRQQRQNIVDETYEQYQKILEAFNGGFASQNDLDNAYKSWQAALHNLSETEINLNVLSRSNLIEDYTSKLEEQSDALEEQADKFKDIISIRKDLLQTYQDEIEYQKTLAEKQKNVADLQTRLRLAQLDTSASGQARVRELTEELNDAQEDLDEYTLEQAIEAISTQLDNENDEYEKFIQTQIDEITKAINDAAKLSSDEITSALAQLQSGTPVTSHHSGGFVMGSSLKDNEEFAKLLQGELVVTPEQMSRFMKKTLPVIATSQGAGSVTYNSPLIEIKCESIDSESIPRLEQIINKAVKRVKEEIDSSFSKTGKKGKIDKFTI